MKKHIAHKPCKKSAKNVIPDMETITLNIAYAFTINAAGRAEMLSDNIANYVHILSTIKPYCEFRVFAELSKTGKLHYHGCIQFSKLENVAGFYYSLYSLLQKATICIKPLPTKEDVVKWTTYISKQKAYMKALFKKYNYPYMQSENKLRGPDYVSMSAQEIQDLGVPLTTQLKKILSVPVDLDYMG